jgi:hypothetical protein
MGTTELIVIAIIVLILFARRLPHVMQSLERGLSESQFFKPPLLSDEDPIHGWALVLLLTILWCALAAFTWMLTR